MTTAIDYHRRLAEESKQLVYFLERIDLPALLEHRSLELAEAFKTLEFRSFTYAHPLVSKLEDFLEELETTPGVTQFMNRGALVNALREVLYKVWELTEEAQDSFVVEELLQKR